MQNSEVCGTCSLQGRACIGPTGDPQPDVVCVCGFPLPAEVNVGAFCTDGGHFLRRAYDRACYMLHRGEHRPKVAYVHAVRCVPPRSADGKKFLVDAENVKRCSYFLKRWLDQVKPKAVIALGADAVRALDIRENANAVRGSLLDFLLNDGTRVPVVPTYHAVSVIKDPGLVPTLLTDIKKAVILASTDGFLSQVNTRIYTKPDEIVEALQQMERKIDDSYAANGKRTALAWDTETTSLTPHNPGDRVIAVSLSCENETGVSFPFEHRAAPFTPEEFQSVRDALQRLLANPHAALIGCNGKFDMKWLRYHYGLEIQDFYYDVQLAEHVLDEGKQGEYSLKDVTRDRFPGMGSYEEDMSRSRSEIQQGLDDEWTKADDTWKQACADARLEWWLALDKEQRLTLISAWINAGYVQLSDASDFVEVKRRKLKGQMVIPKKYQKAINKLLSAVPQESCEGLVLPPRQHGEEPVSATFEDVELETMLTYAAYDAIATRLIFMDQQRDFRFDNAIVRAAEKREGRTFQTLPVRKSLHMVSMPLSEVLAHMEYYGIRLDRDKCLRYIEVLNEKLEEARDTLYTEVGYRFNLSSSASDLSRILFEERHLPVLKRTDSGAPSTDAETLQLLADQYDTPFLRVLLAYRKMDKCLRTYLENWLNMSAMDGKIHCDFNQIGTVTYRLSSSNPNLQNVPFALKEAGLNLKSLFLPDSDDYELYDLDISNAEMRVLTAYAKDEALTDAFNSGKDLHCLTASKISEYTYEDLKAHKEDKTTDQYRKRQMAKKINFGTIYQVGPQTLSDQIWSEMRVRESVEQCQKYLDDFFVGYPGVKRYIDETKEFVRKNKFTYTFTGRRRRFMIAELYPAIAARVARQAVNARIQTTSSDLVMMNIIDLQRELLKLGGRVLLTVHDSLPFQAPKGITGLKQLLHKVITENTAERAPWLPVEWKYDAGRGPNYGDTHGEVA